MTELKPSVATMMITRKCVHNCSTCLIHRPSIDLKPEFWVTVGKKLHDKWNLHVNMYGGEPLCYNGFETIIKEYTNYGINYSMNTCSNPLSISRAKNLIKFGLTNWTASVDSMREDDTRSGDGLRAIEFFKRNGIKDLMIETVVYPGQTKDTLAVIEYAIRNNFWISVSTVAYGIDDNYDSFPPIVPMWTTQDIKDLRKITITLKSYQYNHCGEVYLNILPTDEILYQKGKKCNGRMIVFNPDYDGTMRLCRDIAGERVRNWNALNAIENYDEFHEDWIKDSAVCRGCNWGCLYFSFGREEIIKHV